MSTGAHSARELIAVVEIPKGVRNKYKYDTELGGIKFDRLLMSAAPYPADYGYIPNTLGQDGDVLDALVCLTEIDAARERFGDALRRGDVGEFQGPGGRLPGPERRQ
jgi:inorganic pyrophosphatase